MIDDDFFSFKARRKDPGIIKAIYILALKYNIKLKNISKITDDRIYDVMELCFS